MSDKSTGLGWYADEDWLSNIAGAIGSLEVPEVSEPDKRLFRIAQVGLTTHVITTDAGNFYMKFTTYGNCPYFFAYKETDSICQIYMIGPEAFHVKFTYDNTGGGGHREWEYDGTANWNNTGKYGFSFYTTDSGATSGRSDVFDGSYTTAQIAAAMYNAVYVEDKVYLYTEPVDFLINTSTGTYTRFEVTSNTAPVYYSAQMFYDATQAVQNRWRFVIALASAENFTARIVGGADITIVNPIWGQNMYGGGQYFATQYADQYTFPGLLPYTEFGFAVPYPGLYRAVQGSPASTVNYAKSGAGYSVVCMCKWITSYGGDVYCSPVLISSEPNNTAFTRNSATPSVNNTEHQYQGKTFYMRKAPLDTLTGGEEITSTFPTVDLSGVAQTNDTIFAAIAYQSSLGVGYIPGDEDPYAGGGTSGPGGGTDTDFDITGDTILDSPLPTFSFANTGFARIYNPNLSQLQSLANYLWTDDTFLQTIVNHAKQLLEDPIESIITLNRLPISVPNGTAEVVKVLFIPTNTSMPPVTNQFVDVDCGTLQIKHEYDSALDYNPYTDISLVLPFIGVVQIDPDEVMDKTLSLTYRVDVVSGMCVAKVAVDGCVLYQYSGNCAISMPFNSADFSNYISAMVTAAMSIAGVAAAGAAGAVAAAAEGTGAVKAKVAEAPSAEPEPTGSSLPKSANKSTNIFKETFGKGGIGEGTLKAAKKGVANTVSAVVSSKRTIEHAGHFSGNSGFLGVRRPYAIIKRPRMCNPDEYGKYNGRPCMMYLYLGNLSGYTEVQEIHLTGILATNDELVEIENLLKSGVIL